MIQMFYTSGIPEFWLNPWVGQPPALWSSVMAQMAETISMPSADRS